jgi:hypothetical protein
MYLFYFGVIDENVSNAPHETKARFGLIISFGMDEREKKMGPERIRSSVRCDAGRMFEWPRSPMILPEPYLNVYRGW